MHCSSENVLFNSICLNVLEGIKAVLLVNVVQENTTKTPFKGDNEKAIVKTSKCENLVLYFSEKVQKIAAVLWLFGFQ